jgi:hypothetical protein
LCELKATGYHFVTPANGTIRTVRDRREGEKARDLRDVMGWNLPFDRELVDPGLFDLMLTAGVIAEAPGGFRAKVRVSSVHEGLFLHSGYPTRERDSVFLGPDTYRYVRLVLQRLPREPALVVDVGAGSGVGGIVAGMARRASRIILTDVNPVALDYARANALANGVPCDFRLGAGLDPIDQAPDVVIANPPFIADRGQTYQDGGGGRGEAIAVHWAQQAMAKLRPGGCLILYSGAPIVAGRDLLREALLDAAPSQACTVDYEEIDPDIFGGELRRAAYADVERIAAVGVVIAKLT